MTHPTCKTCKHWGPNRVEHRAIENPETGACRNSDKLVDSTIDMPPDGVCIDCGDGDQVLVTGPEFGCVHHDFKDDATREQWWTTVGDDR